MQALEKQPSRSNADNGPATEQHKGDWAGVDNTAAHQLAEQGNELPTSQGPVTQAAAAAPAPAAAHRRVPGGVNDDDAICPCQGQAQAPNLGCQQEDRDAGVRLEAFYQVLQQVRACLRGLAPVEGSLRLILQGGGSMLTECQEACAQQAERTHKASLRGSAP